MEEISRRAALSLAVAATSVAAGGGTALAQGSIVNAQPGQKLPPGVSRKALGKRESWIPAYKSVSMVDVAFQPGAKHSNSNMPNDMLCHMAEGQLRVTKKAEGAEFTAKKGDVWTCKKGDDEAVENTGSTVAIMRVINLMSA